MPVGITIKLDLCMKCNQMKNHRVEHHYIPNKKEIWTCLKCGNKKVIEFTEPKSVNSPVNKEKKA